MTLPTNLHLHAHHTLTVTLDDDSYGFVTTDALPVDVYDDSHWPAALTDDDTNTIVFLNPTIAEARLIADWLRDMLSIDAQYATPKHPATAAVTNFRYEHLCTGCDCTVCSEGYLDIDYFTD